MSVYLFVILGELVKVNTFSDLGQALRTGFLGGLFGIIMYGAIFWVGFAAAMFVLDIALLDKENKDLEVKLFFEWILISSPFIYWLIKYSEWIFLVAILSFLITQYLRSKRIRSII